MVGAGVAGLSCARALGECGAKVLVLERAHGVGGRCATRPVNGHPVDFGPVFLHGSDEAFVAALEAVPSGGLLEAWPARIRGSGPPCRPDAFVPGARRYAFAEGVAAFPKHLAAGLDVRLEVEIARIEPSGGRLQAVVEAGPRFSAPSMVLALAVEESRALLAPFPALTEGLRAAQHLLGMVASLPCLTVMAGYGEEVPPPDWDILYPDRSGVLHLVSHESAKRRKAGGPVFVYQARPGWSRRNLAEPAERWSADILRDAAEHLGPWAARPAWTRNHAWRLARTDRGCEFSGPVLVDLPGGIRLGLAGEVFSPGGGVEAAWLSGRKLARKLAGEERP